MRKLNKYAFFLTVFFLVSVSVFCQTRTELEKKRKMKEEEINYTKKLLNQTTTKQKQTIEYLSLLKQQINIRSSLIQTVQGEIKYLDEMIEENNTAILGLDRDLKTLKTEYANMLRFAYKNRNTYSKLGFILSAKTFNQAFKRLKLLQNYSDVRRKQMTLIRETSTTISKKLVVLRNQKNEKNVLLGVQTKEKENLEVDQQEKNKVVTSLKSQEKDLRKQLKEQQKAVAELNRKIQEAIKKALADVQAKQQSAGATTTKSTAITVTPETKIISNEFASNMAKLPWPVEKGLVTESFGQHEHPTFEGVIINNNGVNIRTSPGADARAVFGGTVCQVVVIPGANTAVMIRHGEYFTVYSNLSEVYVKKDDKVSTKQKIGKIYGNTKTGITELHFEIWKQFTVLNPESWLYSK